MEFENLKEDILKRAKKTSLCESQCQRIYKSSTKKELLKVIIDNIIWVYKSKMIDTKYLSAHFSEFFQEFGIYTEGKHKLKNVSAILLGKSSAMIETWDRYSVKIQMLESSYAKIQTLESSYASIETSGISSLSIETWGRSYARVESDDSSSVSINTYGTSYNMIETRGKSYAEIELFDSSSATILQLENSFLGYKITGTYSTVKNLNILKLFVNKSKFEIIEV